MKDLYRTLQVDPSAEAELIEAAWRRLAQIYHPDGSRPDADRMKAINVAHDVLKDPGRRAEYDRRRGAARTRQDVAPPPRSAAAGPPYRAPAAPAEDLWEEWHPGSGAYPRTSRPAEVYPSAAPRTGIGCWRHQAAAVTGCASCGRPLCHRCAGQWYPPHCHYCVMSQGHRKEAHILWPIAAAAVWGLAMMVAFNLAGSRMLPIPPDWSPPLVPTLLITYIIGAGVVGGVDLCLTLLRVLPEGLRGCLVESVGWVAALVLLPLTIVAGAVFVPIRAVMAVLAFLRGRGLVRDARASLQSGA